MFYNFFIIYKISECNVELTSYQRNREVILNRAKGYYENDEERLKRQARDKYGNLSEEKKIKRENMKKKKKKKKIPQYVWRKKAKTKRISKNYRKAEKSQYNNE